MKIKSKFKVLLVTTVIVYVMCVIITSMYKGVLSGEIKSVLKAELMIPAQAALDMNKIDTVAYYEIYEQVCKNVEDGIPFKECVKLVDKRIDWYSLK